MREPPLFSRDAASKARAAALWEKLEETESGRTTGRSGPGRSVPPQRVSVSLTSKFLPLLEKKKSALDELRKEGLKHRQSRALVRLLWSDLKNREGEIHFFLVSARSSQQNEAVTNYANGIRREMGIRPMLSFRSTVSIQERLQVKHEH